MVQDIANDTKRHSINLDDLISHVLVDVSNRFNFKKIIGLMS